jgi:hypothetical protein
MLIDPIRLDRLEDEIAFLKVGQSQLRSDQLSITHRIKRQFRAHMAVLAVSIFLVSGGAGFLMEYLPRVPQTHTSSDIPPTFVSPEAAQIPAKAPVVAQAKPVRALSPTERFLQVLPKLTQALNEGTLCAKDHIEEFLDLNADVSKHDITVDNDIARLWYQVAAVAEVCRES